MRLKGAPSDFVVDEHIDLSLASSGPWAVYRLRKEGLTTLQVQARIASRLNLPQREVVFPALKDRVSISYQHLSLPSGRPALMEGAGYRAERIGYADRALTPSLLTGNAFELTVRDLDSGEATRLADHLRAVGQSGLINYFDTQRMGSWSPGWGYIGRAILRRDAMEAIRAYLTRPFLGDVAAVKRFKLASADLWPDWPAIMAIAPRPSNYRSVLTYLIDHPEGYRKALNLIPQRLLSIYLSAYQSHLWNRICSQVLSGLAGETGWEGAAILVAGDRLWVAREPSGVRATVAGRAVALPHHRTRYAGRLSPAAQAVLKSEGLTLGDFKARILKRAYLSGGDRALLVRPEALTVEPPFKDEHTPGRWALRTRYTLPPGSYATLVIKVAAASANVSYPE